MSTTTTVLQTAGDRLKEEAYPRHHTTRLTGRHMSSEGSSQSPGGSKFSEGAAKYDNEVYSDMSEGEVEEEEKQYEGNGKATDPLEYGGNDALHGPSISSEPRLSSWADLDLSVVVALVSPIGSWLTGGDHIKNIFLIVLLIFYLHQLIQVPWELYRASLPRRPVPNVSRPKNAKDRMIQLAHSELQTHQGFYLLLTVISPLLGAMFLRYVLTSVTGGDQLSWFSTTLFILATGMRPWSHLLERLRKRTTDLHDTIHYPSQESGYVTNQKLQAALSRVDTLERDLRDIKTRITSNSGVEEVYDDLNGGLEEIEKVVRRNQRRADANKIAQEKRLASLEKSLAYLLEERRRNAVYSGHANMGRQGLIYTALMIPRRIWLLATGDVQRYAEIPVPPKLNGNGKHVLETILEDPADGEDDEPVRQPAAKPSHSSPYKFVVSPHSLIGLTVAAVTWPLRVFISLFLAIQRRLA